MHGNFRYQQLRPILPVQKVCGMFLKIAQYCGVCRWRIVILASAAVSFALGRWRSIKVVKSQSEETTMHELMTRQIS
jgi:hypothetical protein